MNWINISSLTRACFFCDWQSGLNPNQVDYINAHATSTPLGTLKIQLIMVFLTLKKYPSMVNLITGDEVEAKAIQSLFCSHAASGALALSSTKVKIVIISRTFQLHTNMGIEKPHSFITTLTLSVLLVIPLVRVPSGISSVQLEQLKQHSLY